MPRCENYTMPARTIFPHKWLDNFAYKTNISLWIFLAGGGVMLLIAFIVLSLRTFKIALTNPVKSLRTE